MTPAGRWTLTPVTPELVGRTVMVATSPDDATTFIGMVVEVTGLIITIRDELGDLNTFDTSHGQHVWSRA